MNFISIAVIVLGSIALISALILYVVSKKFAVQEDPRIGQVAELLPGANCGGCGFPGCGSMADALVKAADKGSLEGLMVWMGWRVPSAFTYSENSPLWTVAVCTLSEFILIILGPVDTLMSIPMSPAARMPATMCMRYFTYHFLGGNLTSIFYLLFY